MEVSLTKSNNASCIKCTIAISIFHDFTFTPSAHFMRTQGKKANSIDARFFVFLFSPIHSI
ncbi:hypothetical protein BX070DRAFT_230284 [Coemansia spiralis]|nr:hypothetical protein BX070DRAFT_230284 [Coemansia spiralis]